MLTIWSFNFQPGFTLSMLMTRFSNSSFWQKILTLVSMLMSTVSMVYQNLPI